MHNELEKKRHLKCDILKNFHLIEYKLKINFCNFTSIFHIF